MWNRSNKSIYVTYYFAKKKETKDSKNSIYIRKMLLVRTIDQIYFHLRSLNFLKIINFSP